MSWSVGAVGTLDKVKARVAANFAKAAEPYKGTPEEQDILSAAKSVDAALVAEGAIYLQEGQTQGYDVKANGSRGMGYLNLSISVTKVALDLETAPEPPPAT